MYFLTDICVMCLKNNIKLQSVFIQDNDGIVFLEKLRCCFPEIINSIPDEHKLACTECLEKLRFLYDFKQSGIRNNTVVRNYLGKIHSENKTRQQPSVVLQARKRRKKVSSTANFPKIKVGNVGNSWKIKNDNLNTTNGEQLNKIDHSYQPKATEKINLETKNVEKVCAVADTETICEKQEPQFSEDDSTTSYLDKEAEDLEGNNSSNENDSNFAMSEEGTSRPNDYNNQKVNAIPIKPLYVSDDSVKFCNTCQDLLFKDLNNINLHLYTHIQSSNCSRCEDSLKEINKFQRHMFNHCESMVEMLDKGEHDEKFSCSLCDQQFDEFRNLKKHISDEHIKSLKCVVCSRIFTKKPSLHRHILVTHCHVKLYKCKLCSTRFTTKESIKDHIVFKHYSKVCICKFCQRTFRHSKALQEHISKFHDEDFRREEDMTHDSLRKNHTGEGLFCGICHKQFDDLDNLKKHIYDKYMTSLNCLICSRSYTRRDTLHRHILEQHCEVKLFKCVICFMQFPDKESVKNHISHQHNSGSIITEPENKVFPVIVLNKEKLSCVICKKQLDSFQSLKQHIYDDHMTGLSCAVCSKTFSRRIFLNRHIMELHCQLRIINCKLCPQRFACKESFKDHVDQQHSIGKVGANTKLDNKDGAVTEPEVILIKDDTDYSNEYYSSDEELEADNYEIGKDFSNFAMAKKSNSHTSNSSNLEEVIRSSVIPNATATTEASYCEPGAPVDQSDVCDICHKMFLYLNNLSEHLNAHMQESSCSMCKASSENISRLQRHMLTPCGNTNTLQHTANTADTRTNEKVTCVICQKEFNLNVLKKHMYSHIKNLTCMICNLTFTLRPVLCRHLVHHCNLKPFQCELCDKKYTKKENLKQHVDSKHSSQVVVCQHCQKTIKCPKTLREHIIKQHPNDTHRCEVCKRVFLHKNELKKHAIIHTIS